MPDTENETPELTAPPAGVVTYSLVTDLHGNVYFLPGTTHELTKAGE